MVHVTIELTNNEMAIYRAGETVNGTIQMTLDKPEKFRGLSFVVNGRAKCRFQTGSKSKTTWTAKDVYLNTKTYLFGQHGGDSIEVPAGTHKYDFACLLPEHIPYSFEGEYGSIRYNIEVVLDIPWAIDREIKKPFTVVRIDDLNLNPELKTPKKYQEVKKFGFCCCESQPLIMSATIDYSGYIPGQTLSVTINYDNKSNVAIDRTRVCFKRVVIYNSTSPKRNNKRVPERFSETIGRGVAAGASVSFDSFLLVPQNTLNSNSEVCQVVQVCYYLKIVAITGALHRNAVIKIPITIGNVRLNFAEAPYPLPNAASAPPFTNNFQDAERMPLALKSNLPPSFDEAIRMEKQ